MPRALLSGLHAHAGISNFYPSLRWTATAHYGLNTHHNSGRQAFSVASGPTTSLRRRATSDDEGDLSFSEALKLDALEIMNKRRKRKRPSVTQVKNPVLGQSVYGKWQFLIMDEATMRKESDIKASASTLLRLVDQPENESDMELWSCLLEFCQRRMGYEGVAMLWQSVMKKKSLSRVDGNVAQDFWARILSFAVGNEEFLSEVAEYARWLYQTHGVQWPKLYSTIMHSILPKGDVGKVVSWHITLASTYPLQEAEFTKIMKEYIAIPDPKIQESLRRLYSVSQHRAMYDLIVPHLYSQGQELLARKWRKDFLLVNDGPISTAARPFLRYLIAYFSVGTKFTEDEIAIADPPSGTWNSASHSSDLDPSASASPGHDLTYLINRVEGKQFAIHEKPYNDQLGARWLASTWVSLDFAINVLHTLGVQEIGPLSLRAIAWREQLAEPFLARLKQLARLQIGFPESNYARALRQHASVGDDEALKELVRSDIHPDIFDNEEVQQELLASCLDMEDWETHHLVARTLMAASADQLGVNSNQVLETSLRQGDAKLALQIIQEMKSQRIGLTSASSHMVSAFVANSLSPHRGEVEQRRDVNVYRSLCRELASTRFPPAVAAWRAVLLRLARERRLLDVERLSIEIINMYNSFKESKSPMWACSMVDLPDILHYESPFKDFQELPSHLVLRRDDHPLSMIFDSKMQSAIIRWGFTYTNYNADAEVRATAVLNADPERLTHNKTEPRDFHFARGVRLLAMLRDRGLLYHPLTIRKAITLRLIDLYRGRGAMAYEWVGGKKELRHLRRLNRLNLLEAKELCDKAWSAGAATTNKAWRESDAVVPDLLELQEKISEVEVIDERKALEKQLADELENR